MKNKQLTKNSNARGQLLLIAALCCCAASATMAQGTDAATGDVAAGLGTFLGGFAQSHAWVTTALLAIGALRVVFKPVMELIDTFVKNNCPPEEYTRLRNFESGPIYKWMSFGLDLVGSVKLPVIGIKPSQTVNIDKN